MPPSMGSHSRDTRMGLGYDCKDAPTPCWARTLASIVLILSHHSLGHPEATVRTHLVGQSRNLWNVGGHGLGNLGLERLSSDSFLRVGVGRDGI